MNKEPEIYSVMSAQEIAEHKRLKLLIEHAESPAALTLSEVAELCGLSRERVRQIQRSAEHKVKKAIITNHPDLIKDHTN